MPHWTIFDPAERFIWTEGVPLLFRTESLGDAQCIGIEHIVRSLHNILGGQVLEIPENYQDGGISDESE